MNSTQRAPTRSLGAELERARVERRVRRMTFAVGSLRQPAQESERALGAAPRHLQQIIVDFEAQIAAMDVRLRESRGTARPVAIQRWDSSHERRHQH